MELAGQPFDSAHGRGNRGYAMAALLVGMSVMAVLMGALLPVWSHMATREKEAELIFRGNQYARAIGLFQRKFANTAPPTIDVLVEQRFLRKKYKDPITNDDFQPIYANQAMMQASVRRPGGRNGRASSAAPTPAARAADAIKPGFGSTGATAAGGIIGVTSKSKDDVDQDLQRTHRIQRVGVRLHSDGAAAGPAGRRGARAARAGRASAAGGNRPVDHLACRRERCPIRTAAEVDAAAADSVQPNRPPIRRGPGSRIAPVRDAVRLAVQPSAPASVPPGQQSSRSVTIASCSARRTS